MAIIINIDVMLAKRKMSVTELSEKVGITMANLSILKNGKAKAIRLSTLEAICKALECQPEIFWNTGVMKTPRINKVFNIERKRKLFGGDPMHITLSRFHIFRKKLRRHKS